MIHGSEALAIPYDGYKGGFREDKVDYDLTQFADYLKKLELPNLVLDLELLQADLKSGINYYADIPIGYGLGSSGALVAAYFDRYYKKEEALELLQLRTFFQEMEDFFHGSSSGIDPLVSYLNSGIHISNDHEIELINPPSSDQIQLYLVDTGKSRKTSPLVEIYKEKYKTAQFQSAIEELKNLNTQTIASYLYQSDNLPTLISNISKLQQAHFQEMIPADMLAKVEKYDLKLCGAGGGGFFIGCCQKENLEQIKEELDPIFI